MGNGGVVLLVEVVGGLMTWLFGDGLVSLSLNFEVISIGVVFFLRERNIEKGVFERCRGLRLG